MPLHDLIQDFVVLDGWLHITHQNLQQYESHLDSLFFMSKCIVTQYIPYVRIKEDTIVVKVAITYLQSWPECAQGINEWFGRTLRFVHVNILHNVTLAQVLHDGRIMRLPTVQVLFFAQPATTMENPFTINFQWYA